MIQDPAGQPIEIIGVVGRNSTDALNRNRPTIYYDNMDNSGTPNPIPEARFRAPIVSPLTNIELDVNVVSPSYFKAMGLSLNTGQQFPEDQPPGHYRVGIINQEAADLYFGGKPFGAGVIDDRGVRTVIIGVVRSQVFGTFQQHAEPAIYFPTWQDCPPRMTLIVDAPKLNGRALAELRQRIESVPGRDPAPVVMKTLSTQLAQSAFAPLRIATLMFSASASTALVLSILGLFSALRDAERQRRRELAFHIALGAPRWRIVSFILKKAAWLAPAGNVIGILASIALLRVLVGDTAIISVPPLWVWLIAPLVPTLAVVIASVLPAHRASIVDPLTIMRDDH